MTGRKPGTALSDAEFRLLSAMIRERAGLHFDERTRFRVETRVATRVAQCDLGSVAAYLHQLRSGVGAEEELGRLVDLLTIHETYFFRERSQLEALVQEIVPDQLMRGARAGAPVKIWSAGCASGEEPYSIVMLGLEAGLTPGRDFKVLASDVSAAVLARARTGLFRDVSFRDVDDTLRRRYFATKDGISRIADEVRRHVDFMQLNLVDESRFELLDEKDVIVCRNVIIYFDLATKKRVMKSFHAKLRPGGCLLLGHSESLADVTNDFELKHLERDLVYRRPVLGEERDDVWHTLAQAAIERVED